MNTEEYERLYRYEDSYWWFVARRELAGQYARKILPDCAVVIDVGCGAGAMARELAEFARVVACDLSPLALELCRRREIVNLVRGDLQGLPLEDGVADGVVALDVIEHVKDDVAAMREIARILKPGGLLILSAPAYRMLWSGHDVALHHYRRYTRERLRKLAEGAGLRPKKLTYAVFFLFPLVALLRLVGNMVRREPRANLWWPGGLGNRVLTWLMRRENALIEYMNFPFGVSVFLVAEKPI